MSTTANLDRGMDNLRGRILGMIESWNLDPKHERAAKSTFKSLTYDLQRQLQDDIRDDLKK